MKYLLLALLLAGCSEPKFSYNQNVKVVSGFYKGQSGYIFAKTSSCDYFTYNYYIEINNSGSFIEVCEPDLKELK